MNLDSIEEELISKDADDMYKHTASLWFHLNGCTIKKSLAEEKQLKKYDAVIKDSHSKTLDSTSHKIAYKNMHWSYKHICGTKALYFETDVHAGLVYDKEAEHCWKDVKCTSEATDILFCLADTEWSECLLVERKVLESYVKSMTEHGMHVSVTKTGNTLVWLPLDLIEEMAWRKLDMSDVWMM